MFCSYPVENAEQNQTMRIAYIDHPFWSETIKQGEKSNFALEGQPSFKAVFIFSFSFFAFSYPKNLQR